MSCCGKKLQELYKTSEMENTPNIEHAVYFRYIGNSGIVIKGTLTGHEYRFSKKGKIVGVDFRDALQIAEIGSLIKL